MFSVSRRIMRREVVSCVLVLVLALSSASAMRKCDSIQHLEKVDFGRPFPRHGLMLLYWLVANSHIDNNGLMWLNLEPNRGDYGFHYYGNHDSVLPILHRGQGHYFSLGNLNPNDYNDARALPFYVTESFYNSRSLERDYRNMDRIVVRGGRDSQSGRFRLDEVYITQHYGFHLGQGSAYDPANTFLITPNLHRQIRELQSLQIFTPEEIQDRYNRQVSQNELEELRTNWRELACLGLLLLIACGKRSVNFLGGVCYFRDTGAAKNDDSRIKLEVRTTGKGKARLCWTGIPLKLLDQGVMVVLFKNNDSDNRLISTAVKGRTSGSYTTSVPLNSGLQVRLHQEKTWFFCWSAVGDEIWRGSEFDDANGEIPVDIPGFDASLQLYVNEGLACARLFVKKSFADWESKFNCSWVGFYSSQDKSMTDYDHYQYALYFKESHTDLTHVHRNYDVYMWRSNMAISPGVQARFMLEKYEGEKVRTPVWERQAAVAAEGSCEV